MPIESIDVRVKGNGDVMTISIRSTDPPDLIAERLQTITWLARQLGLAPEPKRRTRGASAADDTNTKEGRNDHGTGSE